MKVANLFSLILICLSCVSCLEGQTYTGEAKTSGFSFQDGKKKVTVPNGTHAVEATGETDWPRATVFKLKTADITIPLTVNKVFMEIPKNGELKYDGLLGDEPVFVDGVFTRTTQDMGTKFVDAECTYTNPNCYVGPDRNGNTKRYCPPGESYKISGFTSSKVQTLHQTNVIKAQILRDQKVVLDVDVKKEVEADRLLSSSSCRAEKVRWEDPTPLEEQPRLTLGTYKLLRVVSGRDWTPVASFEISANDYKNGIVAKDSQGYVLKFVNCRVIETDNQVICYREDARNDSLVVTGTNSFVLTRNWSGHSVLEAVYKNEEK